MIITTTPSVEATRYEVLANGMMLVVSSGTAVRLEEVR